MITKMIFIVFGSAEVQPWNFVEENTQDKTEKWTVNSMKNKEKNIKAEMTSF